MINSSPVPPHELQDHALIGEITTSSLPLATTTNYNPNIGIGSVHRQASREKPVGTAADGAHYGGAAAYATQPIARSGISPRCCASV
jgi:hypothetical protein